MYKAISSLYSNPKSRVLLNDYETDYFDCPIGVKQGDCLSPTLFAIFINDLANEIKDIGREMNPLRREHGHRVMPLCQPDLWRAEFLFDI